MDGKQGKLNFLRNQMSNNHFLRTLDMILMILLLGLLLSSCQKQQAVSSETDNPDTVVKNYVKVERLSSETYYICKYAVTNAEWKEAVDAGAVSAPKYWDGDDFPEGRGNHPVLYISCVQAGQYCQWLNGKTPGWIFRLPTKDEWVYAAAGPENRIFPWGDNADVAYSAGVLTTKFNYNGVIASKVLATPDRLATYNNVNSTRYGEKDRISDIISVSNTGGVKGWVDHTNYLGFIYTDIFKEINDAGGNTCPVDAYPEGVSWCGCYNMSGNSWEWTSTIEIAQNGAEKGQSVNVICGGSWYANASSCKTTFTGEGRNATGSFNTVGLRLVAQPR